MLINHIDLSQFHFWSHSRLPQTPNPFNKHHTPTRLELQYGLVDHIETG
jgi:hypothetical protein